MGKAYQPHRRDFLATSAAATAAFVTGSSSTALGGGSGSLPQGDADILRLFAALEILETDLWVQYNELGGIQDKEEPSGSGNPAYTMALKKLDADMDQYIHDNTDDELTHEEFINSYLISKGAEPVNLDRFRTLRGSQATGANKKITRLTNLKQLTVDTSWWTRYRDPNHNPDLDPSFVFPQAIPGLQKGRFPAIPRNDADTANADHLQAIANTAAFHFAFIEQGGTSLYPVMAQKANHPEVLRILLSIGPTEAMHFQTWHDKAGNAVPVTDPTNGLVFPDLNKPPFGGELFQTNLIMPEPCPFLSRKLRPCSIVRPTSPSVFNATKAVEALTADGLFRGQSAEFFVFIRDLARRADAAQRHGY